VPGSPDGSRPLVVGIGADMQGYSLKEELRAAMEADPGVAKVVDFGVFSPDDQKPYPKVGLEVAERVRAGELDRAVLICGTGLGMAISANKVAGIRAAVAYDQYSVERSVLSNNCQVLCLGGKVVMPAVARRIVKDWLGYRFDPASPSAAKIDVISRYEHIVGLAKTC
jgi:ribose 5-phosphate isomerase B